MKKYRVSLAVKVPSNFEVGVCANTEKEAFKKALGKYENGEFDGNDITGLCWNDAELDINKKSRISGIGNGICIEEMRKGILKKEF